MQYDIPAVDTATDRLLERGIRVLNSFLLAEDEPAHARRLLELMNPPHGAVVLDAGCGVGELARLMHAERPDLAFKLLNVSQHQLDLCPEGMERIRAPFEATGLPGASVDVVLFAFSLSHAGDWGAVLREAHRVLRPGGVVFIFDMARAGQGSNTLLRELLGASAYRPAEILDVARRSGLELVSDDDAKGHDPQVCRLAEVFDAPALYEAAMTGIFPMTLRLARMPEAPPLEDAFRRHRRIAFQYSGGRDSTAALYLLRPYWDRMQVYFLDTGEAYPETLAVLEQVERDMGKPIERIHGDVARVRIEHGLATDVLPVDNTELGRMVSGRNVRLISRYECCARSLMAPMHARMLADGITLIVRGQRDEDYATPPLRSGAVENGIESLYPVQDWTTAQVDAYLKDNGLPVAAFYAAGMPHGSDCMGCTAWWGEGRAAYLRKNHPAAHERYVQRMHVIRRAIDRQLGTLENFEEAQP